MRFIKLFLAVLLIPISQPTAATAANYKGVQELMFADKIPMDDLYNLSIILQRCAGLYGAYAKFLPSDMKAEKEKLFDVSMLLLMKSMQAMAKKRGLQIDSKAVVDPIDKAFDIYVDVYYDHMENTKIMTGTMYDEFFEGEEDVCSNVYEAAK